MDKPIDVLVSGHLCLDLLPAMEHIRLNELTSPGHLFETGPMSVSTGGAVSNTGLALHRLGVKVGLMSNVGDDLIGRLIVDFLANRDPALAQHIRVKQGQPSSYTVVLSPEKVDRIFLHCTGTNATFTSDDIDYGVAAQARIFHLGYPPLLPGLTINDGEELARLFERVHETGTITSLDMTLPDPAGASGKVDWRRLLARTLPYVDIFVPSIEEILFMLRRGDYDTWRGDLLKHVSRAYLDQLADELLDMGVSAVVGFKLGEYGIYVRAGSAARFDRLRQLPIQISQWSERCVWHPAFEVDVVGTTGAGDSAYAGFLTAMLKGLSIDDAARWACAVGACNVEAADATSSIRTWAATQQRMESGWRTLPHVLT